jgi:aspartate aminotransferase-like enzyme
MKLEITSGMAIILHTSRQAHRSLRPKARNFHDDISSFRAQWKKKRYTFITMKYYLLSRIIEVRSVKSTKEDGESDA